MRYCKFIILLLAGFPTVLLAQSDTLSQSNSELCFLNQIIISGHTKTKKRIITRELTLQPGDSINLRQLTELAQINTERLYTISIFSEVTISWQRIKIDSINMLIKVNDRFPVYPEGSIEFADRNFNTWWKEQHRDLRRINLGLTLTDKNFRGQREALSLMGQVGYTQKIGISYALPYIDKAQKHGVGLSFLGLQNREIAYVTKNNKQEFYRDFKNYMLRRFDAAVWYTYRPKYATTHRLKLTWQHYWISRKIAALNPEFLGQSHTEVNNLWLSYKLTWNRVDNWNYPLTGQRLTATLDEKFLMPENKFQTGIYLHYDRYINPLPKWFVTFIFRGKYSFPYQQPYIFQKNLGYDFNYIRGFEYYVIDGPAFTLGRIDLKRCLIDYHIKLPLRYFEMIPIRVYAKIFGDAGMSYNKEPKNDFLNNQLLYSGGFGIDIVTLYDIKIRVEYTFNSLGEKGLFLHKSGE